MRAVFSRTVRSSLALALVLGAAAVTGPGAAPPVRTAATGTDWLQFAFSPDKRANNTAESILTPANVGGLRQQFNVPLPDAPDGAPLLLTNVSTPLGTRDVAYIKGEHGHLWAFDAHSGAQIWMRNLDNGFPKSYDNSAPAIGPDRQHIYVGGFDGKIHKLRVGDGSEVTGGGWPQVSSRPANGGSGQKFSMQLSWATARDGHTYLYAGHSVGGSGHLTVVDLDTGSQHVFGTACSDKPDIHPGVDGTCERTGAHPWSRSAVYDPSLDRTFFDSGSNNNKDFLPGQSWPNTYFAIPPDGTTRMIGGKGYPLDSYTPSDWATNISKDQDMASGGMQLLPVGANQRYPHLGAVLGKDHRIKLVNTADLSGRGGPGNTGGELQLIQTEELNMIRSFSAGWTNPADGSAWIFVAAEKGLEAFVLVADAAGNPKLERRWIAAHGFTASPVIANNILFAAFGAGEKSASQPFKRLQALDPATGRVLWDTPTIEHHWSSPIVANGTVYMGQGNAGDRQAGTSGSFTAWALPAGGGDDLTVSLSPASQTVTPGGAASYTVVTTGSPQTVNLTTAGLPTGVTGSFTPNPVRTGTTATLTLTSAPDTALGSYAFTVLAAGPNGTRPATGGLNVVSTTNLLSGLSVKDTANAADWSIRRDLAVGDTMYGDRAFTFKTIFDRVLGAEWIRPANDSKSATGDPLMTFTLSAEAEVNVGLDTRSTKPGWLDGSWQDRGTFLISSNNVTYRLYRRTFPAGPVSLGPQGDNNSMYVVLAQSSTTAAMAELQIDADYDTAPTAPRPAQTPAA